MACLTTYLDIESCKILRSGFDFTSNLTSEIGDLANHGFLASYVSCHMAMAYDKTSPIFLSLAILNKTLISKVRSKAEFTLQFTIVKDLKYDAYDFVHTISQ